MWNSIDIETYCGVCGSKCEEEIEYMQRGIRLTVTCAFCRDTIENLSEQVDNLGEELANQKGE